MAEERLYLSNKNADVFVLRASPKFEYLATNSIGGEPMNASLAVSEARFSFTRTTIFGVLAKLEQVVLPDCPEESERYEKLLAWQRFANCCGAGDSPFHREYDGIGGRN